MVTFSVCRDDHCDRFHEPSGNVPAVELQGWTQVTRRRPGLRRRWAQDRAKRTGARRRRRTGPEAVSKRGLAHLPCGACPRFETASQRWPELAENVPREKMLRLFG